MKKKYGYKRPTGYRDECVSCIDRVDIAAPPLERCTSIHIQRDIQKKLICVNIDMQKRLVNVKQILTQETYKRDRFI